MVTDRVTPLGSGSSVAWAVLLIVFGFLAIALPFGTSLGVVMILSWLIVFSGVFQLVHAFQTQGVGTVAWKVLVALVYLVAGVYFIFHPVMGVASFTLALAWFLSAEGVMDLIAYFQNRGAIGAGWILLDGIITVLLGVLVWKHWPSSSRWVIGTLVGISMIMTGITRLMMHLAARRLRGSVWDQRQRMDRAA